MPKGKSASVKTSRIIFAALAVVLILAVSVAIFFEFIYSVRMPRAEPCDLSLLSQMDIPDSKIIAVGTPTHGNSEPIKLTLEILKKVYAEYGAATFILEEVAGDAEVINKRHSYTGEDGSKAGMYLIYDNDDMSEILTWLKETNQRFYGIDIQSISETAKLLSGRLAELNFSDAERIEKLPTNAEKLIERNTAFLDEIENFIDGQMGSGKISEQENAHLLHLLDCIKMNYEYIQSGYSFAVRDEMMARNVEWIMDYEKAYYNNDHAVLFASNGHVLKSQWSYSFSEEIYVPMGALLSKKYGGGYSVVLTDAQENYFEAGSSMKNTARKKVFHVSNFYPDFTFENERICPIVSGAWDLDENNNCKLVIIGSVFSNFRALKDKYYTVQISPKVSCDMIIYFELMTPVQHTNEN